jgi:hypothetical protein
MNDFKYALVLAH